MFKDVAAADLAVFFNQNEFAESHNINGVSLKVIVDNDTLNKRSEKTGLYLGELLYYVKASDMARPKPEAVQTFDGLRYSVGSAVEVDGMLEVILKRHGS